MTRFLKVAAAAIAAWSLASYAHALTARQTVEKMVTTQKQDGSVEVSFVSAEDVIPGDQVVYRLNYLNDGDEPAEALSMTMPVPEALAYVENSVSSEPADLLFSADGGASFAPRSELQVTENDQARAARAEDITHVRLTLRTPVPAGQGGEALFRAVVR